MKRIALLVNTLLIGSLSLFSFNAYSSGNLQSKCEENSKSEACQAYLSGVVDGYIASKQKYVAKQPGFSSDFINRVYSSRVNEQRVKVSKAQPACLPDYVDTEEIIARLEDVNQKQDLTTELGDFLRQQYPCK